MSTRNHTPGPWRVDGPSLERHNPNMGLWSVEGRANIANDCTYADAHLIAAAPDLLGALINATAHLEALNCASDNPSAIIFQRIAEARAAIVKSAGAS